MAGAQVRRQFRQDGGRRPAHGGVPRGRHDHVPFIHHEGADHVGPRGHTGHLDARAAQVLLAEQVFESRLKARDAESGFLQEFAFDLTDHQARAEFPGNQRGRGGAGEQQSRQQNPQWHRAAAAHG